eukprot:770316_1
MILKHSAITMSMFLESEAAKRFECVICFEIYKDPVQIGCEEHIFCHECIKELISQEGRSFHCPLCRKKCSPKTVTRVRFIDRQINDLRVQCPNAIKWENTNNNESTLRRSTRLKQKTNPKNNGHSGHKRKRSYDADTDNNSNNKRRKLNDDPLYRCEWKGCYSELIKHKTACPLQEVCCKFCDLSLLQFELKEHHVECQRFPMRCTLCKKSGILRKNMKSHVARLCPMTVISCTECKEEIHRKNKKSHQKKECSESLIECAFRNFGCMEKVKRKDEKKHIENAAFTHNHLIQVANNQTKLVNTVNALKKENKRLMQRVIASEKKHALNDARFVNLQREIIQNKKICSGVPRNVNNVKPVYVCTTDNYRLVTYDKEKNQHTYIN